MMMFSSEAKAEAKGKEKPTVMNHVFTKKEVKVQSKFVSKIN